MPHPVLFTSLDIHKDLAKRAEGMVKAALLQYRRERRVTPTCITWPGVTVKTDAGNDLETPVLCSLEGVPVAERLEVVKKMTERTKAWALVLIEEREDSIRVVFESEHGARAWVTPLRSQGDIRVPGKTHASTDVECVGLLWKPVKQDA